MPPATRPWVPQGARRLVLHQHERGETEARTVTPSGRETPISGEEDDREKSRIEFTPGLSDEMRADADRIFAALRRTRQERHQRTGRSRRGRRAGAPALRDRSRRCPALPTPARRRAGLSHREPARPAALGDLISELRREVTEARQVASALAAGLRYIRGGPRCRGRAAPGAAVVAGAGR